MPGKDANTYLLCHFEGTDGATTTTDATGRHTLTFAGTVEIDTASKKWGNSSALFTVAGNPHISSADSTDWDLCGSAADSWTIDFQVAHKTAAAASNETYISHAANTSTGWRFWRDTAEALYFQLISGGVPAIGFNTAASAIADTNWHHVALCKVADEYGIYVDGTQKGYVQDNSTQTITGSLYIGRFFNILSYDGWMDELRVQHSNYFGAAPVVGLTDTITPPIGPYGVDARGGVAVGSPMIYKYKRKAFLWVPDRIWYQSNTIPMVR